MSNTASGIQIRNAPIRTSERMATSAANISRRTATENGPVLRHIDTMRTALVELRPLTAASLDVLWRDNFRLAAGSFVGWVI